MRDACWSGAPEGRLIAFDKDPEAIAAAATDPAALARYRALLSRRQALESTPRRT